MLLLLLSVIGRADPVRAQGPCAAGERASDCPAVAVSALEGAAPAGAAALDRQVLDWLREHAVIGAAVAVVQGGDVALARGYGWSRPDSAFGMTAGHALRMGSITKTLTAATVLALRDEGRLELDDTVGAYVEGLPEFATGLTLHQLLSHRSGLIRFSAAGHRAGRRLLFQPDSSYSYSNIGFALLGDVVTAVDSSYPRAVRRLVLRPAGIDDIAPCGERPEAEATGWSWRGEELVSARPLELQSGGAAGGWCASAPDLARWLDRLVTGRVLRPQSLRAMLTPRSSADNGWGYGYGISMACHDGWRVYDHSGVVEGFSGQAAAYPEAGLVVVVLTNTMFADAPALERLVADHFLEGRSPPATAADDVCAAGR
mgnify:CR=1 FL=1